MTVWTPHDDGYVDLSSHDVFARGAPHNTFARLRQEEPLSWQDWDGGKGFWNVVRHKDILELNRNTELMSSAQGIRMEDQSHEEYMARRTFQETDPPEHMKTRIKVAKAFSKPVVAGFGDQIRDLCHSILDEALEKGEFDATKEIARKLPMLMLGRIIGTPDEDLPWLVKKGDELIANTDPDFTDFVLDKMDTDKYRLMPFNSPAGGELFDYAKRLMEEKNRKGDTDGVLHLILQPGPDGSVMPEVEFRNFFCLLVAAGNDTTRYSIAAGIQAMAHQQELLSQMQAGGDIWETAPDEIIRWATPALYFRRTATRDFEMHGKTVNAPPAQAGGFRVRLKAIRSAIRRTARSANTKIIIRLRRLLGLYVLNPHIVRHIAARANPIATRPQMLTPVPLAQAAKLSQQFVRTTALQMLNCLADRKPRRDRYQQVHVVTIDVPRVDDHVVRVRGFPDQFPTTQADISAEHLVPVFRRPYDMVLTVPNRVAASFVTLHAPSLAATAADPGRLKGVGFSDPLSGTVKEGDKVLLWWSSGNRDEEAFEDPFRVNLFRTPNRHVSFGQGGPHVCLGMHLARLEIKILFQELAMRIKAIEPAGEHKFLRSNFVGGIKKLPVKVTAA